MGKSWANRISQDEFYQQHAQASLKFHIMTVRLLELYDVDASEVCSLCNRSLKSTKICSSSLRQEPGTILARCRLNPSFLARSPSSATRNGFTLSVMLLKFCIRAWRRSCRGCILSDIENLIMTDRDPMMSPGSTFSVNVLYARCNESCNFVSMYELQLLER